MIVGSRLIVTLPIPMRTLYTSMSAWGMVDYIITEYECVYVRLYSYRVLIKLKATRPRTIQKVADILLQYMSLGTC